MSLSDRLRQQLNTIADSMLHEARKADSENTFSFNNFALLKENNLLGLVIPKAFGGHGLDFLSYQEAISLIAKGCPATASAFNMHNIILGALADIPFDTLQAKQQAIILPFVERVFHDVLVNKKVFASATSEPGIGARYSKTKTTYEKVDGGYLIQGEKYFVTMAEYADYYSIIANKKSSDNNPVSSHHLTFFLVSRDQEGVSIVKEWDTLGMRATQSQRVIFKDAFVPEEHIFMGVTGFALTKIIRAPHWVIGGYMGVYLGVMKASLDFTINYIKERTNYDKQTGLGFEPLVQLRIAELYDLYQEAHYAIEAAANKVIEKREDALRALYLAKYKVGENACELTAKAIKTCGGLSIQKRFDLERFFRDSRCGALMPATSDVCQLYIGRSLLNLSTDHLW